MVEKAPDSTENLGLCYEEEIAPEFTKLWSSSILCVLSGIRVAKSLRQNRDTISIVSPLCVHDMESL